MFVMTGSTENTILIIKEIINIKFSLYFKGIAFHVYLFPHVIFRISDS